MVHNADITRVHNGLVSDAALDMTGLECTLIPRGCQPQLWNVAAEPPTIMFATIKFAQRGERDNRPYRKSEMEYQFPFV